MADNHSEQIAEIRALLVELTQSQQRTQLLVESNAKAIASLGDSLSERIELEKQESIQAEDQLAGSIQRLSEAVEKLQAIVASLVGEVGRIWQRITAA